MDASRRTAAHGGEGRILTLTWVAGLVRRRTGRLIATTLGVALVVTITASLGAFFSVSRAGMTALASAGLPVDWQVRLEPGTNVARARSVIASAPGIAAVRPVEYADTTGLQARSGATVQTTGPGQVLGIPRDYATTFPGEIRPLVGSRSGVLLAQQTAANLHAAPGSVVRIRRPGSKPASVRVQGVIDLPQADSLFQAVGAAPGGGLRAPPDNVVILPSMTWHRLFDPTAAALPTAAQTQVHVKLDPSLPSDPSAAFADVLARARNLEARLAGKGVVGDNLAARLDAARTDATYAELLFLLLGVPAALLAAVLTGILAASGGDRRRREQSLLRIRGASPRRLLGLALAEAAAVGVAGVALGFAGAAIAGELAFGSFAFGATPGQAVAWAVGSGAAGLAVAAAGIVVPSWRDARTLTVRGAQAAIGSAPRPTWARLYLDVVALVAAGLVFWQAVRNGYRVLLAPEGVPTISVSSFTLLAPVLLWIGATLCTWRLSVAALSRGRRALARAVRPLAAGLSGVVAASMSRQARLLGRGVVIMTLATAFALSTAVFDTTYQAQARVDAQLTNGADVTVSTAGFSGLPSNLPERVEKLPGVVAAQPMQHRFAYVGNDLQDLYGIDPSTIGSATNMSDAFFAGGDAAAALATLASRPDGVLVSDETVLDFRLQPGDLLRLRLQLTRDHRYHVVPFHYVGIVREFPTAPRDSFIVANASYIARRTGSAAAQTLLIRTSAPPRSVAAAVRGLLGPASGANVRDIESQAKITLSGLTAIDLSGLTRLELAFAIVIGAASAGVVLALGLAERRRTFAITSLVGARSRQLAAFVWSEAGFVTVGGVVFGALAGWGLAFVVVKILTGVFDPPPQHLSWPWAYLATVGAGIALAATAAGIATLRATRRPAVEILRDL
ncbi:MAG: FtsX-like permease family protein [Actinomycetota bacterium]